MNKEDSLELNVKFDDKGLVPAMIVDKHDKEPLMLAYMNKEAVTKTIETGFVHFYSRSRKKLWCKGETSGNKLEMIEALVDCDQDTLYIYVNVLGDGNACHTGKKSCFYRKIDGLDKLEFVN